MWGCSWHQRKWHPGTPSPKTKKGCWPLFPRPPCRDSLPPRWSGQYSYSPPIWSLPAVRTCNQAHKFNNFTSIIMGACAGCMGPNRRAENYRVNRLTENSPIKNRVSSSELPVNKNKDRILEEINESKRKYEQNNLISTLINSPSNPSNENAYNPIKAIRSSLHGSPEIYIRDSYGAEENPRNSSMLRLKKVQSNSFMDENVYESKYSPDRSPFISQFKTGVETVGGGMTSSNILGELKLNKNMELSYKKKGLPNIPELLDEESKTPGYVKEIRKQNGEDVKPTDLDHVPKTIQSAPKLNLYQYLKDLA